MISSFYGLYSNKFYFFDPVNYIFPLVSLVHFAFLYALWFKITEEEFPDPQMRNLEYALYFVFLIYIFKLYSISSTLYDYFEYADRLIPATFLPLGILLLVLHILLPVLTLLSFKQRKELVGDYHFEDNHIDSW